MTPRDMNCQDPISCQDCRDHFGELLYAPRGEPLDGELAAGLKTHLRECPQCAAELRELQQAQSWLDVLSEQPAEAGAMSEENRPQVALYARLARLQRRRDAWRYAALAASLSVAVLLAVAWWPRPATVDESSGRGAHQASFAPTASPYDWGVEFQRLAQRLDEQDQVLRLLAAELRASEGRQDSRLVALENEAGSAAKTGDLQALRVTAMQHDIDKMREFLTVRANVAQQSAGGSE